MFDCASIPLHVFACCRSRSIQRLGSAIPTRCCLLLCVANSPLGNAAPRRKRRIGLTAIDAENRSLYLVFTITVADKDLSAIIPEPGDFVLQAADAFPKIQFVHGSVGHPISRVSAEETYNSYSSKELLGPATPAPLPNHDARIQGGLCRRAGPELHLRFRFRGSIVRIGRDISSLQEGNGCVTRFHIRIDGLLGQTQRKRS